MNNNTLYFHWLLEQCESVSSYGAPFEEVFSALHDFVYKPLEEGDENRAGDALDLRNEWVQENGRRLVDMDEPTVLELFVSLSRRAAFNSVNTKPGDWVHVFLMNLNIAVDDFMWDKDVYIPRIRDFVEGRTTIFPLRYPNRVNHELWYQMMAYIEENMMSY